MIKFKANSAKRHSIFANDFQCRGNVRDLIAESTFLINRVYCALAKSNEEVAEAYKRLVIKVISDENSPIWNRYGSKEDKNVRP